MKITDFIDGDCEALKASQEFVNYWVKTNGLPCLVCSKYKSRCRFYKVFVCKKVICDEDNPP